MRITILALAAALALSACSSVPMTPQERAESKARGHQLLITGLNILANGNRPAPQHFPAPQTSFVCHTRGAYTTCR
jgi:hypothetical protein